MASTATSRFIWSILPDPLRPLSPLVLGMAVTVFTGVVFLLQSAVSVGDGGNFSPLHMALSLMVPLCIAGVLIKSISPAGTWKTPALILSGLFLAFYVLSEQPRQNEELLHFAMLLCAELVLLVLYLDRSRSRGTAPPSQVGSLARFLHSTNQVKARAQHPPVKAAFYPILKETTVFATIAFLLVKSGSRVKSATGRGLFSQTRDMIQLWFRDGIDPPSYYQLELYDHPNRSRVADYLTRYETKNGVFSDLNKTRENLIGGNEMGDKAFFADFCRTSRLPCPATLATIAPGGQPLDRPALQRDLFIKPHKGCGAHNTLAFSHVGPDQYVDDHGHPFNLDQVIKQATEIGAGIPMLVQPWLRNHPEIADLAKHSLLAIRVITCLNENNDPEAVLAMLRLLSKLEPDWKGNPSLPDDEYATAIDLDTGVMGKFLGDGFTHLPDHHTHHPMTGAPIAGRKLTHWNEIRDLALKAHRLLKHRIAIGWDIALTPNGPVLLEGNHSFDVMFLQRVHMKPIGGTRLGDLLIHHMRKMFLT